MMDDSKHRAAWTTFRIFIQVLILFSIVTLTLETVPELEEYRPFFYASEIVVVAVFTIEYFVNWIASRRKWFPLEPLAIVDLLAILPFYLHLGIDLRGLRAIRLLRVFRLLKIARYSQSLRMLGEAARRATPDLLMFGFVACIIIYFAAMTIYYAENKAQPSVYSSIPASLWWAIVTLTTVGYGDHYPVTPMGKAVAVVVMLTGIGFIAVPTSIITSTLNEIASERRQETK